MIYLWPTLAILLSLGSVAVSLVAWYVDDWQRDLKENSASTSDDAKSLFAAYRSDLTPAELANHVVAVVGRLPRWRMAKLEEGGGVVTIHFVHATPLLRLKSDVILRISGDDGGSILRAESTSRFGKADLGQSPRNLHELLAALRSKPAK